jgi:glycosyltransferase involved in cell wall biosynthesis
MSMEKPVILSDIPAHRYVVGDEKCGIYIPEVNPQEIAKSIEYAYLNRDKLQAWGKVGRGIVEKDYTWQKVAVELEDYLLSLKEAA